MQLLGWVHVLLNIVGLLLWLKWREDMLQSSRRSTGATLLSTLKRAGAAPAYRWAYLGALAGLVLLRALGYWQIGSGVRWTPCIDLVGFAIPFRSDLPWPDRMLLFSFFSLLIFVAEFYFCLLLLSVANRKVPDTDPIQNQIRAHLGWLERLPVTGRILLPFVASGLLWLALGPLLARLGLLPATSMELGLRRAACIGLASMLIWRYLIAGVLLLHLVTSYIYFGNAPFWAFVSVTARNLLKPLGWLPLRFARFDFAPLVASVLVLLAGELLHAVLTPSVKLSRPEPAKSATYQKPPL